MDLQHVIDQIAGRADEFLAEAANRREARPGIAELLTVDYPGVPPDERREVTDAVMSILEEEGFFERGSDGGAAWGESGSGFAG